MLTERIRESLYPAPREVLACPADFGCKYDDVFFKSQDCCGLHGWWLPQRRAKATIVFCHGNGENVASWAAIGSELCFMKANVFVFDYRGYGLSNGSPSETGLGRDGRAAFDYVQGRSSNLPIIAMGRSLGGAVAIELARTRPVAGLVVESSFTSIPDVVKTLPKLSILPRSVVSYVVRMDAWDSLSKISGLGMPKLFAHSRSDDVIKFEIGERLFDEASNPKEFCFLSGSHNHGKFGQKRYQQALVELVARCQ